MDMHNMYSKMGLHRPMVYIPVLVKPTKVPAPVPAVSSNQPISNNVTKKPDGFKIVANDALITADLKVQTGFKIISS